LKYIEAGYFHKNAIIKISKNKNMVDPFKKLLALVLQDNPDLAFYSSPE
jgi:hypothetical protein